MTATKQNRFVPTLETLEAREVASANPVTPPAVLLDHAHVRQFQTGPQFVYDAHAPQGQAIAPAPGAALAASYPDPLINSHRTYVGLKDLRKGDILLNTTDSLVSNEIKLVTNSNYNHAAIYIGNGKVVEAVGKGVHEIDLKGYLNDNDIVRVMVLRNVNLTTVEQDAIASFAKSKVGAKYNVGGLVGAAVNFKPANADAFNRADYFCSQLVAAAYSSAGARLHFSLEQTPGNLADMVNRKLTPLGALYDKGYHRSVREGRECVNLDLTDRERQFVVDFLRTRLNRNGGNYSVRLNRLTVDSTKKVLANLTVTRPGVGDFAVDYSISGGDSYAKLHIVPPKPSPEFARMESHIGDSVEGGMFLVRNRIYPKYFGAAATPAAAPQTAGRLDGGRAGQAQAGPQAPVGDDARHYHAVDAVFAAAGAGQGGQAGRKLDGTGPAWEPVDGRFPFWLPETITHTMTGSGTL
jgi:hypothetical protein